MGVTLKSYDDYYKPSAYKIDLRGIDLMFDSLCNKLKYKTTEEPVISVENITELELLKKIHKTMNTFNTNTLIDDKEKDIGKFFEATEEIQPEIQLDPEPIQEEIQEEIQLDVEPEIQPEIQVDELKITDVEEDKLETELKITDVEEEKEPEPEMEPMAFPEIYNTILQKERKPRPKQENLKYLGKLKKIYPDRVFPTEDELIEYDEIRLDHLIKATKDELTSEENIMLLKNGLVCVFFGIEFIGTKKLGLKLTGLTKDQLENLDSYEKYFIEISEYSMFNWAENLNPFISLGIMVMFNTAIFLFKGSTSSKSTKSPILFDYNKLSNKTMRGPT